MVDEITLQFNQHGRLEKNHLCFLMGDTSSTGWFYIVMLVLGSVVANMFVGYPGSWTNSWTIWTMIRMKKPGFSNG